MGEARISACSQRMRSFCYKEINFCSLAVLCKFFLSFCEESSTTSRLNRFIIMSQSTEKSEGIFYLQIPL